LFPGMIAVALKEKGIINYASADQAFPTLVAELLPSGVKGIVIGGLVAALMSSLASLFNSSATLFTIDFYKKFKPESSEKHLLKVGRIATIVIVILGILWIPVMSLIADVLYEYLQSVQSLIAPGIAAVFLLGLVSRRITPAAGYAGLVSGFVLGMVRLVMLPFKDSLANTSFAWIVEMNWLYYCILLFVLVTVIMIVVSMFTKAASEEKLQGLTFRTLGKGTMKEVVDGLDKWDYIHTVGILGITAFIYIRFW
ncbi:MAG TPA: Na+/glucose cotransporter, partial [Alteromonas sp.]|nr:Na+/glucose cotransporter [Alteromonas sp.]